MAYRSRPTDQSLAVVQVSSQIELAAQDCGQDPNCVCDWAGSPRECLFSYCCGTVNSNRTFVTQGRWTVPLLFCLAGMLVCLCKSRTWSRHFTSSTIGRL
jgi:hypothetical protein